MSPPRPRLAASGDRRNLSLEEITRRGLDQRTWEACDRRLRHAGTSKIATPSSSPSVRSSNTSAPGGFARRRDVRHRLPGCSVRHGDWATSSVRVDVGLGGGVHLVPVGRPSQSPAEGFLGEGLRAGRPGDGVGDARRTLRRGQAFVHRVLAAERLRNPPHSRRYSPGVLCIHNRKARTNVEELA